MASKKPEVEKPRSPKTLGEALDPAGFKAAKPKPSTAGDTSQAAAPGNTRQKKPKRRQGGKGKPFEPGNNAGKKFVPGDPRINRDGRPKTVREVRERINERVFDYIDVLDEIAMDTPVMLKDEDTEAGFIYRGPSHHDRIMAIRELMHTGLGRPKQTVEMSGPGGGPIEHASGDVSKLTSEAKMKRMAELEAKRKIIEAEQAAGASKAAATEPEEDDGEESD